MYKKFLKDPNYLLKYHLIFAVGLVPAIVALALLRPPAWIDLVLFLPAIWFGSQSDIRAVSLTFVYACGAAFFSPTFEPVFPLLIPLGVLIAFPLTTLVHNPSHDSLKPRWLNRPVGELAGLFHLAGFPDWKIIHIFHHQHSDHPELDPHPPLDKGYWEFAMGMRKSVGEAYVRHYMRIHGQNAETMSRLKRFALASRLDMLLRATFWFLLLGPQLFAYLFLASITFKMYHYAWFNHATHRPENGQVVTKNMDHRLYRIVNFLSYGLYYHDNHHARPSLANPKHLQKSKRAEEPNSPAA